RREGRAPSLHRRGEQARLPIRRARLQAQGISRARRRDSRRRRRRSLRLRVLQVPRRTRDASLSAAHSGANRASRRQRRGNGPATDREAQIIINSSGDEVEVSGSAVWGSYDPERVKRGGVHVGELEGKGRPRGQTLAIGYDPDRSDFPPGKDAPPDSCAAKLELHGRYLVVEDNRGCGGLNVSFTGTYVRVKSLRPLGGL